MSDGMRWALLVGINEYERADVTPLAFAVKDVNVLAKTLAATCGFPPDNIFTLTSDNAPSEKPTRGNVRRRFVHLARQVKPNDTFLFFFAGHGMFDSEDETSYLLTYEADTYDEETLRGTCLPAEQVQEWLGEIRARTVLVLYDACRNEPMRARSLSNNVLTPELARDIRFVSKAVSDESPEVNATLYACKVGQRSYEWEAKQHGFFTYFLVEGLKGSAAEDGKVTLDSLKKYLAREVPRTTLKEKNVEQTPWVEQAGAGAGEVVLSDCKSLEAVPTTATLIVTSEPSSADVSVNGKFIGRTPLDYVFDLKSHREWDVEVVVSKEGFQSRAAHVKLRRGETRRWSDVALTPLPQPPPRRLWWVVLALFVLVAAGGAIKFMPPPPPPPDFMSVQVCAVSGSRATRYCPKKEEQKFFKGSEPKAECSHQLCPNSQCPSAVNPPTAFVVYKDWNFCGQCGVRLLPCPNLRCPGIVCKGLQVCQRCGTKL